MKKTEEFRVDETQRLDSFLATKLGETRNQVAQLIKNEAVSIEGKTITKVGLKLKPEQKVVVTFPEVKETQALEVNFDVEILYEDEHLMVINKPSGVTVHPAPSVKEATLVDWLKLKNIRLSTISGEERHGIVHRLDKGTSGTMVVAKSNEAHEALSAQLQDKSMGRYYLAVITPSLKEDFMEVDAPIARHCNNRLKMSIAEHGKVAKTHFKTIAYSNDEKSSLIVCKLFTGRTHQIRVHLESMSRHILGDHIYGSSQLSTKVERILLHATELYFIHPISKEKMSFKADLPTQMSDYLKKYYAMEQINEQLQTDTLDSFFEPSSTERM